MLLDGEVDAAQHGHLAERLLHALETQRSAIRLRRLRPRSRAISQSVNRVSGIVSARKITAVATYGV